MRTLLREERQVHSQGGRRQEGVRMRQLQEDAANKYFLRSGSQGVAWRISQNREVEML